jgi:hypothetical protein
MVFKHINLSKVDKLSNDCWHYNWPITIKKHHSHKAQNTEAVHTLGLGVLEQHLVGLNT